jgi:tetratricopeptide (TPR) repeat protein
MSDQAQDGRALAASGVQALRSGDAAEARRLLRQAVEAGPGDLGLWLNLALAERAAGDAAAELAALDRALSLEPRSLMGLLLKGANLERSGDSNGTVEAYGAALAVASRTPQLPRDLQGALRHAQEICARAAREREAFLRAHMREALGRLKGEKLGRFEEALDVLVGRRAIYRQQPQALFWPGLPCIQFFDRDLFDWLPEVEAATDAVRAELIDVLEKDEGLVPYLQYPPDKPVDQFAELNQSPRWSAFHFGYEGERYEANRARCPKTSALLDSLPQPRLPGLSPASLYSVLKPRTHIPPHTGSTNARVLCHLPLILPGNCWFRCGNATRGWTMGEGFVFDDTIEHEAANESDKVRVVMIFDIWNPYLTEAEKELAEVLFEGLRLQGGKTGFDA